MSYQFETIKEGSNQVKYSEQSFWDFINYVKETPRSARSLQIGQYKSHTGSSSFTGTESFDEAFKLATKGWESGIKQLDPKDGIRVDSGMHFEPAIAGAVVNVAAYLNGQPDCMWEMVNDSEYNRPEVTFYIPFGFLGNIKVEQAMKYCQSIIHNLNKWQETHNVRIVGYCASTMMYKCDYMFNSIVIKDFNDRFVLNSIAFCFHPSFLRRIWFKFIETTEHITGGYGGTQHRSMAERVINKLREEGRETKETVLVMPDLDDWLARSTGGSFEGSQITNLKFKLP